MTTTTTATTARGDDANRPWSGARPARRPDGTIFESRCVARALPCLLLICVRCLGRVAEIGIPEYNGRGAVHLHTVVWSADVEKLKRSNELIPPSEREELAERARVRHATLKLWQVALYDAVLEAISQPHGRRIFVDAPGGTGKTYTFNTILENVKARCFSLSTQLTDPKAACMQEDGTCKRQYPKPFLAETKKPDGKIYPELRRRSRVIISF